MIPRATLFDATPPTPPAPAIPHETFLPDPDEGAPHVSRRQDGWSAANQRRFLEAIAEGHGVEAACRCVGLSTASAYAFRRTARGAAFALGWRAASLVAREAIAETLLVRALEGQVDTYVRADGTSVTRHRHDNRLAMSLLARLDRQVEAAPDADVKAARLVAQEFDAYLDLVTRDEGPARAGLFLARRAGGLLGGTLLTGEDADGWAADTTGAVADLAPIFALAAADRLSRTGHASAGEVPVADLDPHARETWTAEQWQRAEAAGLLRLALPAEPAPEPDTAADAPTDAPADTAPSTAPAPQLPQLSPAEAVFGAPAHAPWLDKGHGDTLVWWCEQHDEWRTRFPPPPGFEDWSDCPPDHIDYERGLTAAEAAAMGPGPDYLAPATLAPLAEGRSAYFAHVAAGRGADWTEDWDDPGAADDPGETHDDAAEGPAPAPPDAAAPDGVAPDEVAGAAGLSLHDPPQRCEIGDARGEMLR